MRRGKEKSMLFLLVILALFLVSLVLIISGLISNIRDGRKVLTYIAILVCWVVSLGAVLSYVFLPGYLYADATKKRASCKENLKKIAVALENYCGDNSGRYPTDLSKLSPLYLKEIPACPAANRATYTYTSSTAPDIFTVYCAGDFHERVNTKSNYPQYDAQDGLIEQ
jgi:hypothetical protein